MCGAEATYWGRNALRCKFFVFSRTVERPAFTRHVNDVRLAVAMGCAREHVEHVGYAESLWLLLIGLTFLGTASSQVLPCLTSLVSLYASADEQGRVLGVFRSLGALARAVGPMMAAVVYWRLGSHTAYYACAIILIIPLIMVSFLPKPNQTT